MAIFNNLIDFVAGVLAALYALPVVGGNYGFAIIMLTAGVMVILMPLTLKATRSTIKMQAVQPQLRKIQKEHKGDRETMNAELMALYQAEGINPVGGCIPMFAQLPFFLVLFRVLHGITRRTQDAPFFSVLNDVRAAKGLPLDLGQTITPSHIGHETRLYQDLIKDDKMHFGPLDLADRRPMSFDRTSGMGCPTSSSSSSWWVPATTSNARSRPGARPTTTPMHRR
jgi:YidC/Oxa1 family membrane protein insertase